VVWFAALILTVVELIEPINVSVGVEEPLGSPGNSCGLGLYPGGENRGAEVVLIVCEVVLDVG
jgi:hypothetical protein